VTVKPAIARCNQGATAVFGGWLPQYQALSIGRGGDFPVGAPRGWFGSGMFTFDVSGHGDFGSAVVGAIEAGGAGGKVEVGAIGVMAAADLSGELGGEPEIEDGGDDQSLAEAWADESKRQRHHWFG